MNPIAIRSLQCVDHALYLPPNVLSVNWFLGKRCNYDCSYCSPHTHDAVSPFIDLDACKKFIRRAHRYCIDQNKKIKWTFTGGEPFIDPGFMPMIEILHKNSTTEQLNVTTNGSLPFTIYQHAENFFQGITISLHLERSKSEINATIKKFSMIKKGFVSVNLMFLPGHLQQIREIIDRLQDLEIPFVVRKITPNVSMDWLLPYSSETNNLKNRVLLEVNLQSKKRQLHKIATDKVRETSLVDFYSVEELDFLALINAQTNWNNCGVWWDDGSYTEVNTDYLVANDKSKFTEWTCYAGVDCIFIDFDGQIYRAMCQNNGPMGHVKDQEIFSTVPTTCKKQWCLCNVDICTRKTKDTDFQQING